MAQWRSDIDSGPRWKTEEIVEGVSDEENKEPRGIKNVKKPEEDDGGILAEKSHLVRSVTSLDAKLSKDINKQIDEHILKVYLFP